MQAVIMAAGRGSRLGHLTEECPKALLKIKGKTILQYNIAMLHRYGIWDITIVTGYRDEDFRGVLKNIPGIRIVYNPFFEFTNVIGSYFMGMKNLYDDVVYMHADTLCDLGIFEDMLSAEGDIVLPVDTKPCDDEAMKVRLEDGKVSSITKQMDKDAAYGEFIGICRIKKVVLPSLQNATEKIMREKLFDSYFEEALQRLIEEHQFDVCTMDIKGGFWGEIDFKEDYERAVCNISQGLEELFR